MVLVPSVAGAEVWESGEYLDQGAKAWAGCGLPRRRVRAVLPLPSNRGGSSEVGSVRIRGEMETAEVG